MMRVKHQVKAKILHWKGNSDDGSRHHEREKNEKQKTKGAKCDIQDSRT